VVRVAKEYGNRKNACSTWFCKIIGEACVWILVKYRKDKKWSY
jgi:hypothetical protein